MGEQGIRDGWTGGQSPEHPRSLHWCPELKVTGSSRDHEWEWHGHPALKLCLEQLQLWPLDISLTLSRQQALVQAAHLKGKTKEFFPGETEISGASQDFQSDAGTQNRPHPSWNVGPRRDLPADLSPHHYSVFRERAKGLSEATPGSVEGEELECSQQGKWREGRIHRKADPVEWIILQQQSSFI